MAGIQDRTFGNVSTTGQGLKNPPSPVSLTGNLLMQNIKWSDIGCYIGPTAPSNPVTYAQWLAGSPGFWAWIET
jgi:hypothetical protein